MTLPSCFNDLLYISLLAEGSIKLQTLHYWFIDWQEVTVQFHSKKEDVDFFPPQEKWQWSWQPCYRTETSIYTLWNCISIINKEDRDASRKKGKSDHLQRERLYLIHCTQPTLPPKLGLGGQSKISYIVIQNYFELSVLYLPFRYKIPKMNPPESAQILCPVHPLGSLWELFQQKQNIEQRRKQCGINQTITPTQESNRVETESDSWK